MSPTQSLNIKLLNALHAYRAAQDLGLYLEADELRWNVRFAVNAVRLAKEFE